MKEVECLWSRALISVCTKCHKEIEPTSLQQEGNAGENLKNFLKARLRAEGHAGAFRVVNSSCLALCPSGQQAVSVQGNQGESCLLVVHPEQEREELVNYLVEKFSS